MFHRWRRTVIKYTSGVRLVFAGGWRRWMSCKFIMTSIITAGPDYICVFFKYFFMSTIYTSFWKCWNKNVTSVNRISKSLASISSNLNNFYSLEVVDRVSGWKFQLSNLAVKGLTLSARGPSLDFRIWRL